MVYTIRNEKLKTEINSYGAEIHSIQTLDGCEYLWQGDPAVWNGQAPNLFPYIARFENGIFATLRNALLLAAVNIPFTIVITGLSVGSLIVTLFTSRSFVVASILWVFFGFAVLSYAQSFLLCRIFEKYE